MAWNDDPRIRELEPYAKKYGYLTVVLFAVHEGAKKYNITTYGRDAKLCKAAACAGDALHDIVQAGQWPTCPAVEPDFIRRRGDGIEHILPGLQQAIRRRAEVDEGVSSQAVAGLLDGIADHVNALQAKLRRLQAIEAAYERSGLDISPCMDCGEPTMCIPDGLPVCAKCGEAAMEKQALPRTVPRRIDRQRWTSSEKAIGDAMEAVEVAGCDPLLTNAVVRLAEAKDMVADYVDAKAAEK